MHPHVSTSAILREATDQADWAEWRSNGRRAGTLPGSAAVVLECVAITIDTLLARNIQPGSSSPGTAISDVIVNSAPVTIATRAIAGRAAQHHRPDASVSQPQHEFQVYFGAVDALPTSLVGQLPSVPSIVASSAVMWFQDCGAVP